MEINDSNFNQIVNSADVVLIDFWSETCGPCKAIMPIIDHLEKMYYSDKRVIVGKFNTSRNSSWTQFGIRNVPTILIFKKGALVDKFSLPFTGEQLVSKINQYL